MANRYLRSDSVLGLLRSSASLVLVLGVGALLWPASLGGQVEYVLVSGESMEPGMHTGDLVIVHERDRYEVGAGSVVIHRVTATGPDGYTTQGDNRDASDTWHPVDEDVVGSRWVLIPRLGTVFARLRNPVPLGMAAAALTFVLVALPAKRETRESRETVAIAES